MSLEVVEEATRLVNRVAPSVQVSAFLNLLG